MSLKLFCCDVSLVDDHSASVISTTSSVAGMSLGANSFYRQFHCPMCGRLWLDQHFHHTGSGNECDWDAQRMADEGDGATRDLYDGTKTWRVQETEYGCRFPTEEELRDRGRSD